MTSFTTPALRPANESTRAQAHCGSGTAEPCSCANCPGAQRPRAEAAKQASATATAAATCQCATCNCA